MRAVTAVPACCCAILGCVPLVLSPATFPESSGPWKAPLVGPPSHLVVPVVLQQRDDDGARRRTTRHGILDTGLGRTIVPATAAAELGIDTLRTSARIRDTAGREQAVRAAVISTVVVGDLTLEDVPVAVVDGDGDVVIGNDILSRVAFEADLDQGTMIFGGPPLDGGRARPEEIDLYCSGPGRSPLVDVTVAGRVVRMSLDTGAHVTAIDEATALELGLARQELSDAKWIHYLHSAVTVDHVYRVEKLGLGGGGSSVEDVVLTPIPGLPATSSSELHRAGLLGMDVLGRFRFRFDPATCRLSVLPRGVR